MAPDKTYLNTKEEMLEFLVEFSEVDLDSMREGDLLNLKDDLHRFMSQPIRPIQIYGNLLLLNDDNEWIKDADTFQNLAAQRRAQMMQEDNQAFNSYWTSEMLRTAQESVRDLFRRIVFERSVESNHRSLETLSWEMPSVRWSFMSMLDLMKEKEESRVLLLNGEHFDVFRAIVLLLVWRYPTQRIRTCKLCSKVFIMKRTAKHQMFCSLRCQRKEINMRQAEKREKQKESSARSSGKPKTKSKKEIKPNVRKSKTIVKRNRDSRRNKTRNR